MVMVYSFLNIPVDFFLFFLYIIDTLIKIKGGTMPDKEEIIRKYVDIIKDFHSAVELNSPADILDKKMKESLKAIDGLEATIQALLGKSKIDTHKSGIGPCNSRPVE